VQRSRAVVLVSAAIALPPARLLTREQSARYLGMSLRFWQNSVQPALRATEIKRGRKVLYDVRELDLWVDQQKGGDSERRDQRGRSSFASVTRDDATISPRLQATLSKLDRQPRASMRRPSRAE
jgi:hypothetical protein